MDYRLFIKSRLNETQLSYFTQESMLVRKVGIFDVALAKNRLKKKSGSKVGSIDIGGTAIKANVYEVRGDDIAADPLEEINIQNKGKGKNYFDALVELKKRFRNLPVGISTAGIVDENTLKVSVNFPILVEQLANTGSFEKLFGPRVFVQNDGVAGLISIVMALLRNGLFRQHILVITFGGGIGAAYMDKVGNIFTLEPGHVELLPTLNSNHVQNPCNFEGRQFVCIERVAAMGAGIESQWAERTGQYKSGAEIAELMYMGNTYATQLFNTSAFLLAHVMEGSRLSMNALPGETVIVGNGGGFNVLGMIESIQTLFDEHFINQPGNLKLVSTQSMGVSNACLQGAAILAAAGDYWTGF